MSRTFAAACALASIAIAAGCTETARFNAACDNVFVEICIHQVDCSIAFDALDCQEEFEALSICNPSVSIDALKTCQRSMRGAECSTALTGQCDAVLCDANAGCQEVEDCDRVPDPNNSGEMICETLL